MTSERRLDPSTPIAHGKCTRASNGNARSSSRCGLGSSLRHSSFGVQTSRGDGRLRQRVGVHVGVPLEVPFGLSRFQFSSAPPRSTSSGQLNPANMLTLHPLVASPAGIRPTCV